MIIEQRDDDLWVLPKGDLDLSAAPDFAEAVGLARSSDAERIVIDLRGLEFLDSMGLGTIVRACTSPDGARIALVEGAPNVMQVLRLSGLESELTFRPAPR